MARTRPKIWPDWNDDLIAEAETVSLGQVREALAGPLGREHAIIRKLREAAVVFGIDPYHGGNTPLRGQAQGEGAAGSVQRNDGLVINVHLNLQSREDVTFFVTLLSELHRDRDLPEGQA